MMINLLPLFPMKTGSFPSCEQSSERFYYDLYLFILGEFSASSSEIAVEPPLVMWRDTGKHEQHHVVIDRVGSHVSIYVLVYLAPPFSFFDQIRPELSARVFNPI